MKKIGWITLLSVVILGCNNTNPVRFGEEPSPETWATSDVARMAPAPVDTAWIAHTYVVKNKIPFIDWSTWEIVSELGGPLNRVTKRKHPFKADVFGIGLMKNGKEREVHIQIEDDCLYSAVSIYRGHPIFIFEVRRDCYLYNNLNDRFFN